MLETIFSWLTTAIGEMLDGILTIFLAALDLDLQEFYEVFPIVANAYDLFQTIAIGIIVMGLAVTFIKYMLGGASDIKEPPEKTLGYGVIAAAAVYMGGYVLNYIVELAKIPYDIFTKMDAVTFVNSGKGLLGTLVEDVGAGLSTIVTDPGAAATEVIVVAAGGTGGIILLEFFVLILIAYNLLKLVLEVCERYVVVGVNVYVSPLYFSTIAAPDTRQIFKKWTFRFLGSCLLMILSAFFLKLVISGLSYTVNGASAGYTKLWMRLLLTLAMCKVAQRADTALQQMGISVATTGSNMLDDFMMLGRSMRSHSGGGNGRGGSKDSVLGAGAVKAGGMFGAASAAMNTWKNGGNAQEIKDAAKAGANISPFHASAQAVREQRQSAVNDRIHSGNDAAVKRAAAYGHDSKNANNTQFADWKESSVPGQSDFMERAKREGMSANAFAARNFNANGSAGSGYVDPKSGEFVLDQKATDAGLSLGMKEREDGSWGGNITGSDVALSDFVANNIHKDTHDDDGNELLTDYISGAIANSSPQMSEAVFGNPAAEVPYNKERDYIASAMAHKAFESVAPDGSVFQHVSVMNTDGVEVDGRRLPVGRKVEMSYVSGVDSHDVTIIDKNGYMNLAPELRVDYSRHTTQSGNTWFVKDEMRDPTLGKHEVKKPKKRR